jgi:hypothetical protein
MFEHEITLARTFDQQQALQVLHRHGHHVAHRPHPVTRARLALTGAVARTFRRRDARGTARALEAAPALSR